MHSTPVEYLITALDGTDADALDRRLAVREAHLAGAQQLAERGVRLELVDLSELAWDVLSRRGLPARFNTLGRHFNLSDAVARHRLEGGGTPTSAVPA